MKKYMLFLPLLGLMALAVTEKLVKIEGTSGIFSDIVIDSKGRWYIVKDNKLCASLDKGVTCKRIRLPSKKSVHKALGIDQFDNIYVQDYKLNMYIVIPLLNGSFVFDNITSYYNERLISRPFALGENDVNFATNNRLMHLTNSAEYLSTIDLRLESKKEILHWVRSNSTRFGHKEEYTFFNIGGPRYWVYVKFGYFINPVAQMLSFLKHMNAVGDHVYCIVNEEKQVRLIYYRNTMFESTATNKESSYVTTIEGIDLSNMEIENDFIIYSPEHNYKTYLYGNIDNKGIIYELGEKKVNGKFKTNAVADYHLDSVRILCGAIGGGKLYFGTSNGVYEMTDIQSKRE